MKWLRQRGSDGAHFGRFQRVAPAALTAVAGALLWSALAAGTQPNDTYQATVGADGPVAQYRFSDAAGSSTLADSAGSDTATNSGITLGGQGPFGGSQSGAFGGEAFATLASSPLSGASAFTAEAWVNWSGGVSYEQPIFDLGSSATNHMYLTPSSALAKHPILFEIRTSIGTAFRVTAPKLRGNVWEYLAVTETSSGTLTLYLDGVQVGQTASATITPASLEATPTAYLGKSLIPGNPLLKGSLSNVAFYTTALSASQVRAHYNAAEFPVNTSPPTISGSARVGSSLSAKAGSWSGLSPITFTYQWTRCNSTAGECANIASATATKYVLTPEDVGSTLRVAVTATDGAGSGSASSSQTATVPPLGPSNTSLPAISGAAEDGQLLTTSNGGWSGTLPISYTYQWESCSGAQCKTVSKATASSYRVISSQIGGTLRVVVTATNSAGRKHATSEATATIAPGPPVSTGAPAISGTVKAGQTLTAGTGAWAGTAPISFTYRWQRCNPSPTGLQGFGAGTLEVPQGIALDAHGDVWLTETFRNVVVEFNQRGEHVRTIGSGGAGPGQFRSPEGIVINSAGDVWIVDRSNDRLEEFNEQGVYLGQIALPTVNANPLGIGTANGELYVAFAQAEEHGNYIDSVYLYKENGEPVRHFGSREGSEPGQLAFNGQTVGLAVAAQGNVWVTDPGNNRVDEFNQEGKYLTQIGPSGEFGLFSDPGALALDAHGDLWVVDRENAQLDEFNGSGELMRQVGEEGSGSGQFKRPTGVAIDSKGNLWVSDSINRRVQEFNEVGEPFVAAACADISGAASKSYTLTESDVESTAEVLVTASNAQGSATEASPASAAVSTSEPPVNLSPPTITGIPQEGQRLSASTGSWHAGGQISYSYQWESCNAAGAECAPIESLTGPEYELGAGDLGTTVRVVVTATTAAGSTQAPSAVSAKIGLEPPSELRAPSISGIPDEHQVLQADGGSWAGTEIQLSYQWESCNPSGAECAPIEGATGIEYDLGEGDLGTTLRLRIGAGGPFGLLSDVSPATPVIGAPGALANASPPSISGLPQAGHALTAHMGSWSDTATITYTYQWQGCNQLGQACKAIEGATESSYTPSPEEVASRLRVLVTAADGTQSLTLPSAVIQPIAAAAAPAVEQTPAITGTALAAHALTVGTGAWSGAQPLSFSYQWERCAASGSCAAIEGASASSYTLTEGDVGSTLIVLVTATNAGGSSTAVSLATAIIEPESLVMFSLPTISGVVQLEGTLSAEPGIWSGVGPVSYAYQWERCNAGGEECAAVSGATEPTYSVGNGDLSSTLRVKVTVTTPPGSTTATSAQTAMASGGELSAEQAQEIAQQTNPAALAASTTATLEEQTVAPALIDNGEDLASQQALTSSTISKEVPGEFAINTPAGELGLAPLEGSPNATTSPTVINGTVALFANTSPATDTIVRPDALGVTTLLQLRSPEARKSFSWEVRLGAGQQLHQLTDGSVAVTEVTEAPSQAGSAQSAAEEPQSSGEGATQPETSSERTEREAEEAAQPESEQEAEEEVPLESLPGSPTSTAPAAEAKPGQPQLQNTQTQYEAATSAMASAESQTGNTTLMVIDPPAVVDAAGNNVPASLHVIGDTVTMTVRPGSGTVSPVMAAMTVAAPSDKTSAARDPFEYGLADGVPKTFERKESTPPPSPTEGVLANLKAGPLAIKTARLVIPYNVWNEPASQRSEERKEKKLGQREFTEWEVLERWTKAVAAAGLTPFITLGRDPKVDPCLGEKSPCPQVSVAQYKHGLELLIAHEPQVKLWGAWNEPDLQNPLQGNAAKAAQFWETAQAVISGKNAHKARCGGCKVVAGEFAFASKYEGQYISCYKEAIVLGRCPNKGKAGHHRVERYWRGPPTIWGFHDYHDVVGRTKKDFAVKFNKFTSGERIGTSQLWITEAAVELQNGKTATVLSPEMTGKNVEVAEARQKEAAFEFLHLRDHLPRVARIYYFDYRQPSENTLRFQKPHHFDSGLLEAENEHGGYKDPVTGLEVHGGARPAFCVLAFNNHLCPLPTVETGGFINGHKNHLTGRVNPNGSAAEYRFEWGPTTSYGFSSAWRSAGAGVNPVQVERQLFVGEAPGVSCNQFGHYQLVARNSSGLSPGGDHEIANCGGG